VAHNQDPIPAPPRNIFRKLGITSRRQLRDLPLT